MELALGRNRARPRPVGLAMSWVSAVYIRLNRTLGE